MIHEDILNSDQLTILSKIKSIPKESYLAGGTALALQLEHRTSLDLDFYTKKHFKTEILLKSLENEFREIKVEQIASDTLILELLGVSFSLFYYPYDLISPLVPFRNIKLASIADIAAMKMIAI